MTRLHFGKLEIVTLNAGSLDFSAFSRPCPAIVLPVSDGSPPCGGRLDELSSIPWMRKSEAGSSKLKRGITWNDVEFMDLITSLTTQVMTKAMDGLSKRHQAIASNLANVETPNYRRRDVNFEGALNNAIQTAKDGGAKSRQASNDSAMALKTTREGHIAIGQTDSSVDSVEAEVTESHDLKYRNDGNSVDVENEMAQLAKNTQRYVALSNMQSRNLKSLRAVISGGS
jgi:flagellar basal-body rod protein FlgB